MKRKSSSSKKQTLSTETLPRRVHYAISSHWDREWYQPFQDYRARLVKLLDKVLDRFQRDYLKGPFTCDGQTVILEDYLEARPERAEDVMDLLREGKIVAGPWYVLPDEFLVSGESLIRNLRMGIELVESLGAKASRAGFVCDLFGHASQLPQILKQIGARGAFVWRGAERVADDSRFLWEGADDTVLPTFRFGCDGYCDFSFRVRQALDQKSEFDETKALADLRTYITNESSKMGKKSPVLIFDGADHVEMDEDYYDMLWKSEFDITHSTLDKFIDEMVDSFGDVKYCRKGELRAPAQDPALIDRAYMIPGVGSSRYWIKRDNARCQTLLCAWAEPFSALANLRTGAEWPATYLDIAWNWLIKNHPHDSICGCSLDEVHEDMKYRFSQTLQIASRLTKEAQTTITASVKGNLAERELRLAFFNPLPSQHQGVVEATVEIPVDWPEYTDEFSYENKPAFRIYDEAGREVCYQRLGQHHTNSRFRTRETKMPLGYKVHEVRIALDIAVPAMGYTTFTVRGDRANAEIAADPVNIVATRHPLHAPIASSPATLENEFIRVEFTDGALCITDKATGEVYPGLMRFEDQADIGDGWNHGIAVNDQKVSSIGSTSTVSIVTNGDLEASLRIRTQMQVPSAFDTASEARSEKMTELLLDSTVTLRRGEKFADVATRVVNSACDHRLRVVFPSGATKAKTFLADSLFDVVERPIALRRDNHLYREMEVESKPQQSWTSVSDAKRGLAIIADGSLLESGVRDTTDRPVILTLFRSTRRVVFTDGQPGGQLLGHDMTFRYRILPVTGNVNRTEVFRISQNLAGGMGVCQLDPVQLKLARTAEPTLPSNDSFFSINGDAVLTSARLVKNSLEIRVFNPTEKPVRSTITLGSRLKNTGFDTVDFLSELTEGATVSSKGKDSVIVNLPPKRIATIAVAVNK